MKVLYWFVVFLGILVMLPCVASGVYASDVKQGNKVTIVTPGTVARLCPHPNCGQNQHIARIPKGTILEAQGIMDVKRGILTVKWFEVTYKGKRGWISIFDTDKAP